MIVMDVSHGVVTFDGHVLEYFRFDKSARYHIRLITSIEVKEVRRNHYAIWISYSDRNRNAEFGIDEAMIPEAEQFIAAVRAAL